MKVMPHFNPYPLNARPAYGRWLMAGAVLLCLASVAAVQVGPFVEPRQAVGGVVVVLASWLLALLLRMVYHHANRANAERYTYFGKQMQQRWWQEHRQQVSMIESVLFSPACSSVETAEAFFAFTYLPAHNVLRALAPVRSPLVRGTQRAEREIQLARWLVMRWQEQNPAPDVGQIVRCYWSGSVPAWQAFRAQLIELMPQVRLPDEPEQWRGFESLNEAIDALQNAPSQSRILCVGCVSLDAGANPGEVALLWLLGPNGGPRIQRGEWLAHEAESLAEVSRRALEQAELQEPAEACITFSQPQMREEPGPDWDLLKHLQDANFGALGDMEAMVALTLACWYTQVNAVPCSWLASDPTHSVALGVVKPYEPA